MQVFKDQEFHEDLIKFMYGVKRMTDEITEAEANDLLDSQNNVLDAPVKGSEKKKKVQKPTETTEGENTNSGTDQQEMILEVANNETNNVPNANAGDDIQNEQLPSAPNYMVNVAQAVYGSGKAVVVRDDRIFYLKEITIPDDAEKKKVLEAAEIDRLGLVVKYLDQTKKRKRESSETTVTSSKKSKTS